MAKGGLWRPVAGRGDQRSLKRRRALQAVSRSQGAQEVAWITREIALGGPWTFYGQDAARRTLSLSDLHRFQAPSSPHPYITCQQE